MIDSTHSRLQQHPLDALQRFLLARLHDTPSVRTLVIAFSAGPDSLALLLAAAQIAPAMGYRLRALHVHHGLHPDADLWAAKAIEQAAAVNVPCTVLSVTVAAQANIEAAARQARYDALAQAMLSDEALVLAHHQDDQAETVLLRLMRGAGLNGLKAMEPTSEWVLPSGHRLAKWRPWLALPRQAIEQWFEEAKVGLQRAKLSLPITTFCPVQDPANSDARYARTLLRSQVLPLLEGRWPEAKTLLARSAEQLAQQSHALSTLADYWLSIHAHRDHLLASTLTTLDAASLQAVISRWLQQQACSPLPAAYWPRVQTELLASRADANPMLHWSNVSLRRYRDGLYLVKDAELIQAVPEIAWVNPHEPLEWAGQIWLPPILPSEHPLWQQAWRIAPRQGGERWLPAGRHHHVLLKHWCQEQAIPPWQRQALWCLWAGDIIVKVGLTNGLSWSSTTLSDL